jgi:hypothetical protein
MNTVYFEQLYPFIVFPYLPPLQQYLLGYLYVIIIYLIYLGIASLPSNLS